MPKLNRLVPVLAFLLIASPVQGQEDAATGPVAATIEVTPLELTVEVGASAQLTAVVRDADGMVIEDAPVLFFSRARRDVEVTPAGFLQAHRAGEFEVIALAPADADADVRSAFGDAPRATVKISIPVPPVASVAFAGMPDHFYADTTIRPAYDIVDVSGAVRTDVDPQLSSSDPRVAQVTALGHLKLVGAGSATLTAQADEVSATLAVTVVDNPAVAIQMEADATQVRTGDVVHLAATAVDADGRPVPAMPITFSYRARTDQEGIGEPPSGLVTDDGRFVADIPGEYTILASAGNHWTSATVVATPRNVKRELEVLGQGRVADRKTSDIWVWEAPDGRDYAVTGTWGAAGHALFWDVTDTGNIQIVDMVRIDARTVNDVKVSEDGSICILSREGASDRKNGLVILDCSSPAEGVSVLARYDDQMTGGVHNVFIYEDHVYALSGGQRYDVINIEDPRNPYRVGRFELDTPGHSIHDVWIVDGVAVSSNWSDGLVVADVGGGGMGGSPQEPIEMGRYAYPSGWNHAGWPFHSKSANKFYVIGADEAFPSERNPLGFDRFEGPPVQAAGWVHFVEFDELDAPREVARYEVPYGGTHNFWVEDEILYIAYYNAGLRIVDISGELLGDLYRQGREIAYFLPFDPQGFKPNAPRTWGTMTHKGNIFFADNNSGVWAVRFKPDDDEADTGGE
jgi:hypothetical protein